MLYLPDQVWPTTPVTPRDTLEASATAAADQQLTVAAENAALRVIYGTVTIGPQIACVLAHNGALVILAVWGHGEVDSITQLYLDDKPATLTAAHYTGTAGQTVNAALVAAFAAQTPAQTYTDALPGICYSVITVPAGESSGFPRLTATIKGRKVWTGAASEWSNNPAYCLADFCTNTVYGMGKTVDWASVAAVAADCNVLAGGTEPLRTLDLALDTVQQVQNWLDTLRTYAGCWVVQTATGLYFVSDKAGSSVATYTHYASQIQSISAVKKRGTQSIPTVMTITYRDTTTQPVRDGTAVVYAAGVLAGTTPRRESSVSLPGITRYSQAYREATERLNKLTLNDLSCTLAVFDEALTVDVGDIITVSHPIGLTDKLMRVMGLSGEYGRYTLTLVEYDPAVYSAAVATAPTYTDTTLPNPSAPPAVTGVAMAEEVFPQQNGTYSSRWRVTWTAATYTFLAYYRAELWIGPTLIFSGSPSAAEWVTPPVQEAQTYTVKIAAVSSIGSTGAWGTQSAAAQGKQLVPSNVPSISAFEAGGRVYVSWLPAVDIDIWRYEVRYGAVGVAWASTILLDRVDALRLQTDQMPVGTWTLHVKALDSVGNYSAAAATVNVVVTSDAGAFLIDTKTHTTATLTNMAEYSLARDDSNRYFVSEDAALWDTKFASTLNTYTAPLSSYHASMTSTWLGEAKDFGLLLGGNWAGTATVADISGSHISYFGSSPDMSAWTYTAGLSQKLNARGARLKHEALTTATMLVTLPTQSIRLDAIPREEVGTGTSSSTSAKTVFLANDYVAVKTANIAPQGTAFASSVLDNIGRNGCNPADKAASIILSGSGLNTVINATVSVWNSVRTKHPIPSTGWWYWEMLVDSGGTYPNTIFAGVSPGSLALVGSYPGAGVGDGSLGYYGFSGGYYQDGTNHPMGATYTTGDVIGLAYNANTGTISFYKNNVLQGSVSGLSGEKFPCFSLYGHSEQVTTRWQTGEFSYVPPAGYSPLPFAFDVHIFNDSGTRIARDFLWSFQGV